MKILISIIAVCAVSAMISCGKVDIPEPNVEGLPFELKGIIGGEIFQLGIDQDGIAMRTNTNFNEVDSIWEFTGSLSPVDGRIGPSINISFRPDFAGRALLQSQESIFSSTNWDFYYREGRAVQRVPLTLETSFLETDIHVADISIQGFPRPVLTSSNTWQLEVGQNNSYPLCMHYESMRKNSGTFCTHIFSSIEGFIPIANWDVMNTNDSSSILIAKMTNHNDEKNFKFDWGEGFQEKRRFSVTSEGNYKLRVADQNGYIYSHEKYLLFNESNNKFYTYNNEVSIRVQWGDPLTRRETRQKMSINIELTDVGGAEWYLAENQFENAYFRILDRRAYNNDRAGNRTVALYIEFSCLLTNDKHEILEAKDIKGWIAVGISD